MINKIVTECFWHGYSSSQASVVHRTVHRGKSPYAGIHWVEFSDGTGMSVYHRKSKQREKIQVIHGYERLLDDIVDAGVTGRVRVRDLPEEKRAS